MFIILVYNALFGYRIVRRKHCLKHPNQAELNSYEETGQERYQEWRHMNHLYDVTIADVGQRAESLLALIKDKRCYYLSKIIAFESESSTGSRKITSLQIH